MVIWVHALWDLFSEDERSGVRSVIEMLPYLKTIGFCALTFVHILREGDFKDQ